MQRNRTVDILENFLKEKEKHEQSLSKVFEGCKSEKESDKKSHSFETDIYIALAEHLLGKLAPGLSYAIDNRVRGKREEKCICKLDHCTGKPVFQSTGIGDERAWHEFINLMFSSHPLAVVTVKNFYGGVEDEESESDDEEKEDSPGGKAMCEINLNSDHGAENQAIAQTIVFSFIQQNQHASLPNFLIPNILISPYHFRISMYDSLNDILICSVKLPIFQDKDNPGKLVIESLVFLWIVLHYKIFCSVINVQELLENGSIKNTEEIQSKFQERAREKLPLYEESSSKIGISRFQPVSEEEFPSLDSFLYGKRLFKPRRL